MPGSLQEEFRSSLSALIGYLCRQYTLRQEMGSICRNLTAISMLWLQTAVNWITRHITRICDYLEAWNENLSSTTKWSVLLAGVRAFTTCTKTSLKSLQAKKLVIIKHGARLRELPDDWRSMANVSIIEARKAFFVIVDDITVLAGHTVEQDTIVLKGKDGL